jgi:hypothetical protein
MITDKDLTRFQLGIYGFADIDWSYRTPDTDSIVWGKAYINDTDLGNIEIIALRGSVTLEDWKRDFEAIADPFSHSVLGPVHPGFCLGMDQVCEYILKGSNPAQKRIIIGHSLGAARAAILTGLLTANGTPPISRVVWGEPLSGEAPLKKIISNIPTRSYWNGDWGPEHYRRFAVVKDPVPSVPLSVMFLAYVRASAVSQICVRPSDRTWMGLDTFDALHWHNFKDCYAPGTPATSVVVPS